MGCTNSGTSARRSTICLYKGGAIELKRRPGTWELLTAELKRLVGRDTMEVSILQSGQSLSLLTETTWASLSSTNERLVLVVQPESVEETLSLRMTGLRKRDRKYSEVGQTIARLKSATDAFDRCMSAWFSGTTQRDFPSALLFTYYQAPAGIRISDEFPYLATEEKAEVATVWTLWEGLIQQIANLETETSRAAKHIEVVSNKRAIKRTGVFKKSTINASLAKAQENNVKLTLAMDLLSVYTRNLSRLRSSIAETAASLREKSLSKPAVSRFRSATAEFVALCL